MTNARTTDPRLPLSDLPAIRTRRGAVGPRSPGQAAYMEMLGRHEMVFGIGPAGTGKTYLAVAQAVAMLAAGRVERIVLSRPAVEAGERLGFLPGDMKEKVDPYLRPLYDALDDMMPGDQVIRRMGTGEIEVAPLAFMRGRTLAHAFVILDEAQNTTPAQMKMFLTRMGEGTRMVITGDLSQVDLPPGTRSGLRDALDTLEGVQGIGVNRFDVRDVVRHPLVARIVDAYDQRAVAERDTRGRAKRESRWSLQVAEPGPSGARRPPATVLVADPAWRAHGARRRAPGRPRRSAAGGVGTVVLASDRAVKRLNARHRGRNKPTNVLTFDERGRDPGRRRGAARGRAAGRRGAHVLAHLVVHGALHLRGHDHRRRRRGPPHGDGTRPASCTACACRTPGGRA